MRNANYGNIAMYGLYIAYLSFCLPELTLKYLWVSETYE